MRMPAGRYLYGACALALLGVGMAQAAPRLRTMNVDAPDGSVVQIHYTGDVAPEVEILPVNAPVRAADASVDPFVQIARISAIMDARMQAMQHAAMVRHAAMMQQMAQMQREALFTGQPAGIAADGASQAMPGVTLVGSMPPGAHVTYYSSTTSADGCTRSVTYSSDGSGAAPRLTQAASDGCGAEAEGQPSVRATAGETDPLAGVPGRKI